MYCISVDILKKLNFFFMISGHSTKPEFSDHCKKKFITVFRPGMVLYRAVLLVMDRTRIRVRETNLPVSY